MTKLGSIDKCSLAQTEGRAKALKQEQAWSVQGTLRDLMELEKNKQRGKRVASGVRELRG